MRKIVIATVDQTIFIGVNVVQYSYRINSMLPTLLLYLFCFTDHQAIYFPVYQ